MKINKLSQNEINPRYIEDERFEKLKQSISEFPKMLELRPIIYDPNTMQILGGNMRYRALVALGYKDIPNTWLKSAADLSEEEKRRFIIEDNVGFGEWDWEIIQEKWDVREVENWGVEIPGFEYDNEFPGINLPTGSKEPYQQMTFTFADMQADFVKNAIMEIKKSEAFNSDFDTYGNKNANANAIYLIVKQWAEQKK